MNKTLTVNIAGSVFHIDENAFVKLDHYLKTIKKSFSIEEQDEIIHDIEIRISELFLERLNDSKQNITLKDVDQVIEILGTPEDYIVEETSTSESYTYIPQAKKLYRDTQNGVLGGVLAGLGHYFKIDPVWLRIIFAILVLFFGTGVFLYLILWIVIPEAKTTSQILEMQGEPITVETIQKKVKENIEVIQEKFQQVDYNKYKQKAQLAGKESGRIVSRVLGIIFVAISSTIILTNLFFLFLGWINKGFFSDELQRVNIPVLNENLVNYNYVLACGFFLFTLPFVALLVVGLRMIYTNLKYIALTVVILFLIWVANIFYFTTLVFNLSNLSDQDWEVIATNSYFINSSKKTYTYAQSKPSFTYPNQNTVNQELATNENIAQLIVVEPNYFTQQQWNESQVDQEFISKGISKNIQIKLAPSFSNEIYAKVKLVDKQNLKTNKEVDSQLLNLNTVDNQIIIASDFGKDLAKEFSPEDNLLVYTIYLPKDKGILMNNQLKELLNNSSLELGKNYTIDSNRELICLNCN